MKKIIALVLALAMILMVGAVFADDEPVGKRNSDGTVTVTGLDKDDVAHLYKIVEWKDGNWALTHEITGITVEDITLNKNNTDGITLAEAELIAKNPGTEFGSGYPADSQGKVVVSVTSGTYLVLVVDKNSDTIYNPIFVSSDYDPDNTTNVIDAKGNSLGVAPDAKAKKQDITIEKVIDPEKNVNDKRDLAVGDDVPFVVTSNIPTYAENYTNPEFYISDSLSAGLTYNKDVTVAVEGYTLTSSDYEIKNVKDSGFTVAFSAAFLKSVRGNPEVTLKYTAKLNNDAVTHNVDLFVNDVTLTFSNDPTNASNHGTRDDKTRHYSFSIDANVSGKTGGGRITKELVKIGVDENGDPITAWQTTDESKWEKLQLVQGAKFELVHNTTNKKYPGESDKNGAIQFNGLDAGTYTLTETEAPEGYVKEGGSHTVSIVPTYEKDSDGNDILLSYVITIDGEVTSSYNVTHTTAGNEIQTIEIDNSSMTFPILNTRGVALPSTGGIGTTIFYILGGLLVVGAAVILVARRRVHE